MHLLRTESRSLDEAEAAIDLGQSPAGFLFLSFSDSDLSLIAAAARQRPMPMSLQLANLGALKHPYSVDLYIGKAASHARFVLIRLLGGLEYWRYGIEEFSRAARKQNFKLAIIPGDAMDDERLDDASTVPAVDLRQMHAAFQHGQLEHIADLFDFIEKREEQPFKWRHSPKVKVLPAAGRFEAGCRSLGNAKGRALIVFYRSLMLAGDTAPVGALADALAARAARRQRDLRCEPQGRRSDRVYTWPTRLCEARRDPQYDWLFGSARHRRWCARQRRRTSPASNFYWCDRDPLAAKPARP